MVDAVADIQFYEVSWTIPLWNQNAGFKANNQGSWQCLLDSTYDQKNSELQRDALIFTHSIKKEKMRQAYMYISNNISMHIHR